MKSVSVHPEALAKAAYNAATEVGKAVCGTARYTPWGFLPSRVRAWRVAFATWLLNAPGYEEASYAFSIWRRQYNGTPEPRHEFSELGYYHQLEVSFMVSIVWVTPIEKKESQPTTAVNECQ